MVILRKMWRFVEWGWGVDTKNKWVSLFVFFLFVYLIHNSNSLISRAELKTKRINFKEIVNRINNINEMQVRGTESEEKEERK